MLEALLLGALAGTVHVLTGPDHMAAVAPLATRPRGAWVHGFLWGIGHTSGVWAVGCVALLARGALPLHLMSSWGDRLAAGALILVGAWTLKRWVVDPGARVIAHRIHVHAASGFGILHGMAGSSHYLGVLPALGFASSLQGSTYLAAFGVATIAAMTACAWLLGMAAGVEPARRWLSPLAGAAAIIVGVLWLDGQRL